MKNDKNTKEVLIAMSQTKVFLTKEGQDRIKILMGH
jgi:hypothetical protein